MGSGAVVQGGGQVSEGGELEVTEITGPLAGVSGLPGSGEVIFPVGWGERGGPVNLSGVSFRRWGNGGHADGAVVTTDSRVRVGTGP